MPTSEDYTDARTRVQAAYSLMEYHVRESSGIHDDAHALLKAESISKELNRLIEYLREQE